MEAVRWLGLRFLAYRTGEVDATKNLDNRIYLG